MTDAEHAQQRLEHSHKHNNRVREIWTRYAFEHRQLAGMRILPLLRGAFKERPDLLFVGMNPSISDAELAEQLEELNDGTRDQLEHEYAWFEMTDDEWSELEVKHIDLEMKSHETYGKYYKPIEKFAKRVKANTFEHMDMFLMRHTSQKEVREHHLGPIFSAPATALFNLFTETLLSIDPKIVVIVNAQASHIAKERFPLAQKDNYFFWEGRPKMRFYLGSMISGGNQMDIYSRARLERDVELGLTQLAIC